MGKIKMGGSAVMEFEPDYCEFHITVSIQKDTSSEALSRGRQRVEEILQLLTEKAGLKIGDIILDSESNDFSDYSDEKYYTYTKSFYFKYKADNKFTDTVVKLLEKVEDAEYEINFKLANQSEKDQIVMMAAVADAREKAEKLATALGTKINGYKEITHEFHSYTENNINMDWMCNEMEKGITSNNSLASQMGNRKIEISKSVDVIWLTE